MAVSTNQGKARQMVFGTGETSGCFQGHLQVDNFPQPYALLQLRILCLPKKAAQSRIRIPIPNLGGYREPAAEDV